MNQQEPHSQARSFEDLVVFQEARQLVSLIYDLTRNGSITRDRGLVDQMRRAAVSVLSNIAEGFERGTNAEFARSLYIAKGSCGELRAQALVARDQRYWADAKCDEVATRCRTMGRRLSKFITYLRSKRAASPKSQG